LANGAPVVVGVGVIVVCCEGGGRIKGQYRRRKRVMVKMTDLRHPCPPRASSSSCPPRDTVPYRTLDSLTIQGDISRIQWVDMSFCPDGMGEGIGLCPYNITHEVGMAPVTSELL